MRFVEVGALGASLSNAALVHFGVDRGWHGAEVDFASGNTFESVALCHQSLPRHEDGGCPTDPLVSDEDRGRRIVRRIGTRDD